MLEESPDLRLAVYTPVDVQSARKVKLLRRRWNERDAQRFGSAHR